MGHLDTGETRVSGQRETVGRLPLPQRPSRYTLFRHWLPVLRKITIVLFGGGALAALGTVSMAPNERDLRAESFAFAETQAGIAPGAEWLAPVKAVASSGAHGPGLGYEKPHPHEPPLAATCRCPEGGPNARSPGEVEAVGSSPERLATAGTSQASDPLAPGAAPPYVVPATSNGGHEGGEPTVLPDGRVVLNVATLSDLVTLPGIGPKRAMQILELRARLGKFRKVSDLLRVKGIGIKSLRKLTPRLVVDHPQ